MPILPGLPFLEELHRRDVVRRDAAVRADLHDAVGRPGRLDHRAAFVDRVADRLLDVDVGAGFDGGDHDQRVPVVGRGDDDDLGLFALEQLAVVLVLLGRPAGELLDLGGGGVELVRVDVAQGDHVGLARRRWPRGGCSCPTSRCRSGRCGTSCSYLRREPAGAAKAKPAAAEAARNVRRERLMSFSAGRGERVRDKAMP